MYAYSIVLLTACVGSGQFLERDFGPSGSGESLAGKTTTAVAQANLGEYPSSFGKKGQSRPQGHIRREIVNLEPDHQILRAYGKAIQVMKRLPDNDPHSWVFQANIHGFPAGTPKPDPNWAQCQHGNWWFLPWHRGYLYFFEKIVRKYAEDESFAMPYWNYSNPRSRHLPAPFRDPGSPLYDSARRFLVNSGVGKLPYLGVVIGLNRSMASTAFAAHNPLVGMNTFGGPAMDMPHHKSRPHGALERLPHDLVHGFIGGNMIRVEYAARDPIFWLHHSNMDRLWEEWRALGQGRANPTNDVWLSQGFTFYDENKKRISITVRQMLDIRVLDYHYEKTNAAVEISDVGT
jgi:hypothetical protein